MTFKPKNLISPSILILLSALTFGYGGETTAGEPTEKQAATDKAPQAPQSEPALHGVNASWHTYIEPFINMGPELEKLLANPDDDWARHELYEYMFAQLASGYVMLFYSDPANPDWWPLFSHVFDALWANPDTVYYYSVVDPEGTYRIAGDRGEARMVDIQLGGGKFVTEGASDGHMGLVQANVPVDSFNLDEAGNFEVIVSPEKPEGYEGDWIEMTPDTTYFLLRQVSYDWSTPQAEVSIERLDTPARGNRRTVEELQARLEQLSTWTRNWISLAYRISQRDRARSEEANDFVLVDWLESGFGDQKYHNYAFDLKEGEAVLIEGKVPEGCDYWSYQLVTNSWRAINPLKHQSNLNPHTGHVDSAGMFRAVIADADPGVHNWLDVGGHKSGLVYTRFKGCEDVKVPSARVVQLSEVLDLMPEETLTVTAEERENLLRDRAREAQLRRRW